MNGEKTEKKREFRIYPVRPNSASRQSRLLETNSAFLETNILETVLETFFGNQFGNQVLETKESLHRLTGRFQAEVNRTLKNRFFRKYSKHVI